MSDRGTGVPVQWVVPDRCDHREDALSDPDRDTVEDPPTLLFCHVPRDVYSAAVGEGGVGQRAVAGTGQVQVEGDEFRSP